ncbi:hypothetical protein DPMN_134763 [Dreissena polymorpha]|uniref:Uncharacterized protein n=1 Tax=Dreissena polymorpha TaxID=45954 RepID=A0A9D4FXS4_DREPO|nr:hypothetical protein DPMN_134763 [Dreissena polymorpha]
MSQKTALNLLWAAQGPQERPEHDCNTCWPTRAPTGDLQTAEGGLVLIRHQARLSFFQGTLEGGLNRGRQTELGRQC